MYARNASLSAAPVMSLDGASHGARDVRPPCKLDLSGPVLGARYRLVHRLGSDAIAAVHAATDLESGRRVAVRLLREPQRGVVAPRYFIETRAALNLCHPNIANTVDFGRDILGDGEPVAYVVTEYLAGESLAATLEFDGPLAWRQVLAIAMQICLALIEAHEQCIVHCNVGPSTCFRVLSGEDEEIKLLDFGSAAFACKRTGQCKPAPCSGAPGSAAPELLAGSPFDHRVDIYALGLLMYRLTTHARPYNATHAQTEPIPMRDAMPRSGVPAAFEAVVRKALASDPALRYVDAQAMHDALVQVEQCSRPTSRLANDPLCWGRDRHQRSAWHPPVPAASSASLAYTDFDGLDAEDSSQQSSRRSSWSAWMPSPTWPALLMRAALAITLTTVALQTAWTLLS